MTLYKCDRCKNVFIDESKRTVYTINELGNYKENTVDLCGYCATDLRRITTDFLYGEGEYDRRKANHSYIMSYAM